MTSSELVDLQDTLYSSSNPTRRWLHVSRRDRIFRYIETYMQPGSVAVEVGPGSGIYLPRLCARADTVYATDIEKDYLRRADELAVDHRNLTPMVDDITQSALPDSSVDFALCTEVIEHISDGLSVIENLHRILKPDGILVLSTPQAFSPLELTAKVALSPLFIGLVRKVYKEPVLETGHINLFTESRLRRYLVDTGFSCCEADKSGLYLPLLAEFLGDTALGVEQKLEAWILGTPLDWLLWTQYFVLRKSL